MLSTSPEAATAASPKALSDTSSDTRRDQLTANEAQSPFEEASRDTLPIVPMKELIDQLIDEVLPTIPQQDHVDTSFPHSLPAAHHRRRQVDISQSIFTGGVHWTSETEVSDPDCKVARREVNATSVVGLFSREIMILVRRIVNYRKSDSPLAADRRCVVAGAAAAAVTLWRLVS
ncbi:hypothetical protein FOZ62_031291 [Perkinsus olseni]|uniref:Uncharacterized protein n=1 Tax=Perkinsus olseni TaxID=32597 RepID=A0A7J6S9Z1_PEROL|nr:hypothetical protein FOZ62_031291 [Perkinsus olseni]